MQILEDRDGNAVGYEVACIDPATHEAFEEFTGDNSVGNYGFVPADDPYAADCETIRQWAIETADGMAEDYPDAAIDEEFTTATLDY
jgi:hypothetical protein